MEYIRENELRYLCEGFGPHGEKRYEVWEKGDQIYDLKRVDKLEWWSSSREAAIQHFEMVKDRPKYKAPRADWGWLDG